ncbi:ATP-binding cassette domain-containing protein, partial [Microseira wollei]|uniref:ATP-binding cassette domain-containing protein n=1 Tax=Microseira wollei TaxID=467598 RepID=UPI001CFC9D6F
MLYGGSATTLQLNLLSLGFGIGYLPMILGFLPSLFRVLEAPPDLPLPTEPKPIPRPIRQGFIFERVSFTYPGRNLPVLDEVSFCIKPEECMALVGCNGAGKTTIVKLLLRLYDPTAGRILLDGIDLREYDLASLRGEVSAIFQDFVHYELSAGENVGVGQGDILPTLMIRIQRQLPTSRLDIPSSFLYRCFATDLEQVGTNVDEYSHRWFPDSPTA